ncbi:MAG: serine/threonine-protein phosphatase [Prevotella sp.]|nr:serine/threonine-protein phosphatase [Prevotella sp.]
MLEEASDQRDDQRLLTLADSLAKAGDIRTGESHYWQGLAHYHKGDLSLAEFYWQESIDATANSDDATDLVYYAKSASYLSSMYCRYGEFAKTLQISLPVLKRLEQQECDTTSDYTNLVIFTGCCKAHFDKNDTTAVEMFEHAHKMHNENIRVNPTKDAYHDAVAGLINIAYGWNREGEYEKGLLWTERFGQFVSDYRERFGDDEKYIDKQWGRYKIFRAIALAGLGRLDEADSDYDDYQQTRFSKSMEGMTNSSDYLTIARRWDEALSCYSTITDYLYQEFGMYSLENIQRYMLKKYRANAMNGNNDSTNLAARQICEVLDSAITRARRIDAEGIQNIHKKDTEILQREIRSAELRKINFIILILGLIVAFTIFTIIRHRAAKRLAKVNAAKERMEGELNIARDIQKSMVPSTFPQREGLDMYASMTPAREVGGDLYSFLQKDDILYFCIGDVSGKGVPASLFMTQATRLFRTLASQDMDPAEIATHMNAELAEENEQGMFVTMFICRLNMKLHLLEYCNAGHNPPVLGNTDGQFSFLDMEEANAPIGLWPGLEYEGETIDYYKDRLMLLYTDGLNEAENASQEQFGEERIINILTSKPSANAQGIIEALEEEVALFRDGAEPNDDLTMLCLSLTI